MFKENNLKLNVSSVLPGLDCGACGFRTCILFEDHLAKNPDDLKLCIHIENRKPQPVDPVACLSCHHEGLGANLG